MIVARKTAVTVDELENMPDGDRFELDHGYLVERSMSPECAVIGGEIFVRLHQYLSSNPIGKAFPDNCGYTLNVNEEDVLRKPDVSVVFLSKLPGGKVPKSRFPFSPDVAVEVLSPSDNAYDMDRKIREYLSAGTQMAWLVRPNSKRINVIMSDESEISYGPNDLMSGDPVLPGFRMRVGDVFPA